MLMQRTVYEALTGIETTATILPGNAGFHKVVVITRFASGNFTKTEHENQSLVAAQGLLKFYTTL